MSVETLLSIYAACLSISFTVLISVLILISRELSDLARYTNEIFIEFRSLNSRSSNLENRFLRLFEKLTKIIVREDAFSRLSDCEFDDLSREIARRSGRTSQDKSDSVDEAVSNKGTDEGVSRD